MMSLDHSSAGGGGDTLVAGSDPVSGTTWW